MSELGYIHIMMISETSVSELNIFAKRMLLFEEGREAHPYDCGTGQRIKAPVGFVTIGIGRNLDANPLSDNAIQFLFTEDLIRVMSEAQQVFTKSRFDSFGLHRQLAIIGMIFHLGIGGFLDFKKMIEHIKSGDWNGAITELWDSKMGREERFKTRLTRVERLLKRQSVWAYQLGGLDD